MKILFIAHRIPYPPDKGDKIRSFFILKHLSQKNDIYLASLIDDINDIQYKNDLTKYCKDTRFVIINKLWVKFKMVYYLIIGKPMSLAYFGSCQLKREIDAWVSLIEFDMIYIYSSSVGQYVINVKNNYKIMDFVDLDSEKWFLNSQYANFATSLIYKHEGYRMRKYESFIARKCKYNFFAAKRDESAFKLQCPEVNTLVIPNGVNLEYFTKKIKRCSPPNLNTSSRNIIFTGAMDYFANIDAAVYFYNKIFPIVKSKVSDCSFFIVGSNPSIKIMDLAKDKSVIVTGRVVDIRPYMDKASVYVAPLRISRGLQNKVLEAMAMGMPVVTTKCVLNGINAEPGKNIFIEDSPLEFADRVVELLRNTYLRDKIGDAAREFVQINYNWGNSFNKLDNLIKDINDKTSC